jgi:hypothetical protein
MNLIQGAAPMVGAAGEDDLVKLVKDRLHQLQTLAAAGAGGSLCELPARYVKKMLAMRRQLAKMNRGPISGYTAKTAAFVGLISLTRSWQQADISCGSSLWDGIEKNVIYLRTFGSRLNS